MNSSNPIKHPLRGSLIMVVGNDCLVQLSTGVNLNLSMVCGCRPQWAVVHLDNLMTPLSLCKVPK